MRNNRFPPSESVVLEFGVRALILMPSGESWETVISGVMFFRMSARRYCCHLLGKLILFLVVVMWHWDLVAVAVWTVHVRVDLLGGVWVEVRELFAELIRVV